MEALRADKPVLLVRFERLVTRPAEAMADVARFLGLDYVPAMSSPANSYDQHWKTKLARVGCTRPPRPAPLDLTTIAEWAELLAPGQAEGIVAALPADLAWTLHDRGEALPCRWT